jgi:hypothetical protein
MYTDKVCLNDQIEATCANEFGFFLIHNQTGLEGLHGILGLSPT